MQHQGKKIELQNDVEPLGKLVEETSEVTLLGNGFTDFQKRFELTTRMLQAGSNWNAEGDFFRIVHEFQNSTGFEEVTTIADGCANAEDLPILGASRELFRDIQEGKKGERPVQMHAVSEATGRSARHSGDATGRMRTKWGAHDGGS